MSTRLRRSVVFEPLAVCVMRANWIATGWKGSARGYERNEYRRDDCDYSSICQFTLPLSISSLVDQLMRAGSLFSCLRCARRLPLE